MHKIWRQFRPRLADRMRAGLLKKQTFVSSGSVYDEAWRNAQVILARAYGNARLKDPRLEAAKKIARQEAYEHTHPFDWLTSLILQAPEAVLAQNQMDQHKHGYRNREARLYELIDFNDTYVSTVLSFPSEDLSEFNARTKVLLDRICKQARSTKFSDVQWDAITHGLSREIAVYRAARATGYDAEMTTRSQDALGIDMVIREKETGRYVNIDCKTRSAFHYRLEELANEGRIMGEDVLWGESHGFLPVVNGHDDMKVQIVLWSIDEEKYGEVNTFMITNLSEFTSDLTTIMHFYGKV